jgi:hypothetical protein
LSRGGLALPLVVSGTVGASQLILSASGETDGNSLRLGTCVTFSKRT